MFFLKIPPKELDWQRGFGTVAVGRSGSEWIIMDPK
jgi:hypothetical protein